MCCPYILPLSFACSCSDVGKQGLVLLCLQSIKQCALGSAGTPRRAAVIRRRNTVEKHQFPPLQVALASSEVLSTSFASESVYLVLGVWGLSSEICTGCCSSGVLRTGLGSQCEMALGHLWRQKAGVADTPSQLVRLVFPQGYATHQLRQAEARGEIREQRSDHFSSWGWDSPDLGVLDPSFSSPMVPLSSGCAQVSSVPCVHPMG